MGKIELIMAYIRQEAAQHYNGDTSKVPCPDRDAWTALSSGRHARLPNESQLILYANQSMRTLAAKYDMRRAYFAVAMRKVTKSQSPS